MNSITTISGGFSWRVERALRWPVTTEVGPGLKGVIACTTQVSWLDPESGLLAYRGIPIERLAGSHSFEQVAYLLISGCEPRHDADGYARFCQQLRASRRLPPPVIRLLRAQDPAVHPTLLLRAGVSALGCHELTASEALSGERHWRELRIVGQVAALVAEISRWRRGQPPEQQETGARASGICPGEAGEALPTCAASGSLAGCMLQALLGRDPLPVEEAALDLLWVLYADHGLDAPTFTSMIVASCLADPYYNVVAGLSALRGPRLGATEQVLAQLLPLRDPQEGRRFVQETLAAGGVIAGFGHRLYRMADPRVVLLRKEAAVLARSQGADALFAAARAVEQEATALLAPRGVHININFYAALLFHLLGAEAALVPCLYVVGRMAGLVARVREALGADRLYRPTTCYVGPNERLPAAGQP